MAVMIFTVLNGLGIVFLLYVLVQFWKEQHRPMKPVERDKVVGFPMKERPTVLVVTHLVSNGLQVEPAPVSTSAHGGLCVVSRQANRAVLQDAISPGISSNREQETPMKRFSTR
jgi:hypothetical protein